MLRQIENNQDESQKNQDVERQAPRLTRHVMRFKVNADMIEQSGLIDRFNLPKEFTSERTMRFSLHENGLSEIPGVLFNYCIVIGTIVSTLDEAMSAFIQQAAIQSDATKPLLYDSRSGSADRWFPVEMDE